MEKHDTLLIACADPQRRHTLCQTLQAHYNILEAVSVRQTLLLLEHNLDCICAVLMDASMRTMPDKLELLGGVSRPLLDQVPVIVITPDPVTDEALSVFLRYGAADVIPADYEPYAMLRRIQTIAQLHLHKQHLQTVVRSQADIMRHSSDNMVEALSSIIECRSVESGNHILRVRCFTRILMEEVMRTCPEYGLDERAVAIISSASALHDIGKIVIPDAILMKPGPLTQEEWDVMQTHTLTGCRILDNLSGTVDPEYLRYAHNICHYHHERWDGGGHPEGLSGEEIPICAQAVGLADAYDALTSQRVYKSSYSFEEAVNMILQGECGTFSPKLLECFKHVTEQFDALTREYSDGRAPEDSPFDMTLPPPDQIQGTSLDHSRAMYYALVHYVGAFLVEVDLDKQIFHVVYNPYPETASLQGISSLGQLQALLLERIVIPQEREQLRRVLFQDADRFLAEGQRRRTYHFHYQDPDGGSGGSFEMVFLRPNTAGQRRSLSVLCRKVADTGAAAAPEAVTLPSGSYICRNDACFTLVRLDDSALEFGGYSLGELRERFGGRLAELIHPEDRDMVRSEFTRQLQHGALVRLDHRVIYKDGSIGWVSNKSRLMVGPDGQEYLYCSLSDISQTKAALEGLKQRMHQYEVILAQTENVLFDWDIASDTIDFSGTWGKVFGREPIRENLRSHITAGAFFHPDDTPLVLERIQALEDGSNYEMAEVRLAVNHGRYLWCRIRASAARDEAGRLNKVMGIIININSEKLAQRDLQDRAERDSLTRLLNKDAARKQAESYLSRSGDGLRCALLVIDLDDFKGVNDQYGHLFGDTVLTRTARAIEAHFQPQDILARIGGDEFLVLVRGVADRNLLTMRCRSLIDTLSRTFREMNKRIHVSCSIGIALAPQWGRDYYSLFACADQALYWAKALGKNTFCFYEGKEAGIPTPAVRLRASTPIDSDRELGLAEDNLARFAFQKLYSARDVKAAVTEIMAMLGRKTNVSRVYIFENTPDGRFCDNTFEWCNQGITPEMENLQHVSYETDIPGYSENFNEQGVFYCPDVAALPPETYDIVASQGIKSMLQCAIRQEGVFRGYIGFDECQEQRLWTKEEISLLTYVSDVLSAFLLAYREQERHRAQARELRAILDGLDSWIYILDPDTFRLKYLNEKARTLAPNVHSGMVCYQALMERQSPCPGCPVAGIRERRSAQAYLTNRLYGGEVLAEASLIPWQGQTCCYMGCRKLPPRP